jgi:hypothetical protein
MTSRKLYGRGFLLVLAGGFSLALMLQAIAQAVPADADSPAAETTASPDAVADAKDADLKDADLKDLELDWSQLNVDIFNPAEMLRVPRAPKASAAAETSWSSKDKSNGASAVSVKQSLSPFWDARIGADMTVVNQPQTLTGADLLRQKYSPDGAPSQSSGTAWAAITAPGAGSIWDKTSVEARVDPSQEQSKLGTSLSKSLPLNEQYSLTLQNGYSLIQQGIVPVPGIIAHPTRNYQSDQSARLSIADSGTSFTASQSLSSTDDKWLRKIGAEQKLFGGVSISGSIGETALGPSNKSLTAGFRQSW